MSTPVAAAAAGLAALGYYAFFAPGSQVFGPVPARVDTAESVVALTFDDGPNEPFTSRLADVLESRGVRATFFQVGRCVERSPHVTRRLGAAGHVIANHSYSHRLSSYVTQPSMQTEIIQTQSAIQDALGLTPGLFRSPWLYRQPQLLASVRRSGLQVVSGRFGHPLEVLQPPAARLTRYASAHTRPGSILIFHDGFDARGGDRAETVACIGPLIDDLRWRGYRFGTVDELLEVPAYQATPPVFAPSSAGHRRRAP